MTSKVRLRRRVAASKRGSSAHRPIQKRLLEVRLFLCDVDGILTDGTIFISAEGESKLFNILDGLGLRLLQKNGIKVGWISNRPSPATERRAHELKVDFLVQQKEGTKVGVVERILEETGLKFSQACFMGDDIVDLAVLRRVGFAVTVPDGIAEAKRLAHYTTKTGGGRGAVREVVEMILKAQGKWGPIMKEFLA